MLDVQGFILVGGASSRMGSDKAQLKFDGQSGVELIAAALQPNVGAVRLVGSRDEARLSLLQNVPDLHERWGDRKSTRLNSSHQIISYAVFCLKKKKKIHT